MKSIPNYHPPSDYRRPTKTQEKVYVPVNDYPEINFSMITNPLTPNHSCITCCSGLFACSSRAYERHRIKMFSSLLGSFLANPFLLAHFLLLYMPLLLTSFRTNT